MQARCIDCELFRGDWHCQHSDPENRKTYSITADEIRIYAEACNNFVPLKESQKPTPTKATEQFTTVTGWASDSEYFDSNVSRLIADGWQPVAFSTCSAVNNDQHDVHFTQTLVSIG